jgi:hypothetical protein
MKKMGFIIILHNVIAIEHFFRKGEENALYI